jgi:RNA polymerase sigma-70 factor, ECF subfamily
MTASMMYANAESPTALDRYPSQRRLLGGSVRDPSAGSAGIDRDSQLIDALRLREPTAAEGLVARYGERAYRLTIGITGNKQDAEEAVQDAFWSVIRKIDTFRGGSAFGSWVYRIVSNAAYAKVRRRRQAIDEIAIDEALPAFDENGRHAGSLVDWSSRIDDPAVQTELRTVLSSALSELPAHYRAVVVMHDVEGWSMAEIANGLGITVATAKTRAHRARLLLRRRLSIFMTGEGSRGTPAAPCRKFISNNAVSPSDWNREPLRRPAAARAVHTGGERLRALLERLGS